MYDSDIYLVLADTTHFSYMHAVSTIPAQLAPVVFGYKLTVGVYSYIKGPKYRIRLGSDVQCRSTRHHPRDRPACWCREATSTKTSHATTQLVSRVDALQIEYFVQGSSRMNQRARRIKVRQVERRPTTAKDEDTHSANIEGSEQQQACAT